MNKHEFRELETVIIILTQGPVEMKYFISCVSLTCEVRTHTVTQYDFSLYGTVHGTVRAARHSACSGIIIRPPSINQDRSSQQSTHRNTSEYDAIEKIRCYRLIGTKKMSNNVTVQKRGVKLMFHFWKGSSSAWFFNFTGWNINSRCIRKNMFSDTLIVKFFRTQLLRNYGPNFKSDICFSTWQTLPELFNACASVSVIFSARFLGRVIDSIVRHRVSL